MNTDRRSARLWLIGIVAAHLIISIVHGIVHREAQVPLSPAAARFVVIVILAGPLAGVALMWPAVRLGTWVVAIAMAGSLIFGVLNHFMLAGPDHVAHVAHHWKPLFAATAVLLAVTEALGAGLALRLARKMEDVA
jgi:hypothetical protein